MGLIQWLSVDDLRREFKASSFQERRNKCISKQQEEHLWNTLRDWRLDGCNRLDYRFLYAITDHRTRVAFGEVKLKDARPFAWMGHHCRESWYKELQDLYFWVQTRNVDGLEGDCPIKRDEENLRRMEKMWKEENKREYYAENRKKEHHLNAKMYFSFCKGQAEQVWRSWTLNELNEKWERLGYSYEWTDIIRLVYRSSKQITLTSL